MEFADVFEMAFAIRHNLQRIVGTTIPMKILTFRLSLVDVLTKATLTTEKHLMIDLGVVQDAYQKKELEQLGFTRSEKTRLRSNKSEAKLNFGNYS